MQIIYKKSGKKYLIFTFVLSVIFFTAITSIISWTHLKSSNIELRDIANQYQNKTKLAMIMWDVVRARESAIQNMLIIDDPFEIDEAQLHHFSLAEGYLQSRTKFKALNLDAEEIRYIADLDKATTISASTQNHVKELVINGDLKKARTLSRASEYTEAREHMFQQFENIFNYYRDKSIISLDHANNTALDDTKFILSLTAMLLLSCVVIGFYTVRKMAYSEQKLQDEISLRIASQAKIEKHKEELEISILQAVEKYRLTEIARHKSQETASSFGHILETSLNEMYIFDVESLLFIQVNEGARKNLGYTLDELKKLTPLSLKPKILQEEFRETISPLLLGTENMVIFTTVHKRKDGTLYPVEVHLQKSTIDDKAVLVAMVLDITNRREWEKKLQIKKDENEGVANELAFQKIALEEHSIVWILDHKENIISVNSKFEKISLYDRNDLIGNHFCASLINDNNEEKEKSDEILDTIRRGDIWHGVLCFSGKDDIPYWTKSTITPFFNKHAEIYQYVVVSTDITELKVVEEKLLSSNAYINQAHIELDFQRRALDEHAIVSFTDKHGNITYVNDKFCELSQYSRDELLGKDHSIINSDVHSKDFFQKLWETISQGQVWKGEICNKKKNGELYWLAATIVPFLDEDGKSHKYIAIRFDITEQKINEQKLITRNEEIEAAHKELDESHHMMLHSEKLASVGQLAAGIAHEINTPTQFLGDNTRFLQEAFVDLLSLVNVYKQLGETIKAGHANIQLAEKAHELSDEIEVDYLAEEIPNSINQSLDGISRISKIVRSMKDFSHPGTDNLENVDINKSIESTINVSRNEWKYVSEMVTNFDTKLTSIPCYPGELNQVILNMIVNAAHAITDARSESAPLGTITINTKLNKDNAEIRISDTGTGIKEEVRSHIFEPFFTTKGVGKGTGQGLSIAYAVIVDKHKGSVAVESDIGKGTTFIITLPIANNKCSISVNASEAPTKQSGAM